MPSLAVLGILAIFVIAMLLLAWWVSTRVTLDAPRGGQPPAAVSSAAGVPDMPARDEGDEDTGDE